MLTTFVDSAEQSFLIWSYVYPMIGLLLGVAMIIMYVKTKENKLIKPFGFITAFSLLYGLVYTAVYCAASLKYNSFTYIYIIRSYEGFIIDFVVWLSLMIHSIISPVLKKQKIEKAKKKALEVSKISDDEKMKISNF